MNSCFFIVVGVLGMLGANSGFAAVEQVVTQEADMLRVVHGTSYDIKSDYGKVIFKIERTAEKKGTEIDAKNVFSEADAGKPATTEEMIYANGKFSKLSVTYHQTGERRTVQVVGDKLKFTYTTPTKTKEADADLEENTLIPDQILPFIQKHWDQVMKGDDLTFYLVALTRLELIKFKIQKDEEKDYKGMPSVVLKMKPNSFIIAALVKPIYFTIKKDSHELLEYKGRVVPFQKVGSDWKDLDATNVYFKP